MRVVLLLLALTSPIQAQIYIKNRVPNSPEGCCGRAVLVTVAQHQGYKMPGYVQSIRAQPYGQPVILERGCPAVKPHPCWSSLPELASDARRYGMQTESRTGGDTSLFGSRPVIISYKPDRPCGSGHIVAFVGQGMVYDPNYRSYQPVEWHRWKGDSLILK